MFLRRFYCFFCVILFLFSLNSCVLDEEDKSVTFSGTIVDSSRTGIVNAKVKIDYESGNKVIETTSSGGYEFELPHGGTANLTFYKEGYTPQSKVFVFKDGERISHYQKLNSLQQDAFFDIDIKNLRCKNRAGGFGIQISTNVNYEIENTESWIKYQIMGSQVYFSYEDNQTLEERTAVIKFVAEYGLHAEATIVQEKGPILELTDYIEKDGKTNILTSDPFISFNREVKLKSISSSYSGIDLTPSLSNDKKTIYFPKVKLPIFESVSFSYEVEDTNGELIQGLFTLKLFEKYKEIPNLHNSEKMLFRPDNKSFWTRAQGSLQQYSTEDLSLMNTIEWDNNDFQNRFFYNRYNDCLYLVNYHYDKGSDISIYSAKTGTFIKQLDLSGTFGEKQIFISRMGFGYNGLGVIFVDKKVYYIDSKNGHILTLISDNSSFPPDEHYPDMVEVSNVEPCNNGKFLLLPTSGYSQKLFCVDVDLKKITTYENFQYYSYKVNYTYPGIIIGSYLNEYHTYWNVVSGEKNIQKTTKRDLSECVFVGTSTSLPVLFTASHSLIDMNRSSEKLFAKIPEIYPMASSDNGNIILLGYSKKLYLFNSDLFTKYSEKIK